MKNFLAIDIGNSHITAGVYRGEKLLLESRCLSENTDKEFVTFFDNIFRDNKLETSSFYGCGISSVVKDLTQRIENIIKNHFIAIVRVIHSGLKLNFLNKYEAPENLGVDRICAISAAVKKYGYPLIVADFGTATTIDYVNQNLEYLGGVIIPGLNTMAKSLKVSTSQLPDVKPEFPLKYIGNNTIDCIKSGITYGSLFMFESFVDAIQVEYKEKCKIVITGGFANLIGSKSKIVEYIDNSLVLDGIKTIYDLNYKN